MAFTEGTGLRLSEVRNEKGEGGETQTYVCKP